MVGVEGEGAAVGRIGKELHEHLIYLFCPIPGSRSFFRSRVSEGKKP